MKHFILIISVLPFFTFCGQPIEKDRGLKNSSENQIKENINETATPSYQTIYYLIRHAEKVRTDPKDQDSNLDTKGIRRAKVWAKYFEPIKIDNIYMTKYIRTKQTISPVAQQKSIPPIVYDPNTVYSENFLKDTEGKSVLVVGHSNTIPYLVNKLIKEERFKEMDDNDNATLFKVTINGNDRKVETITVE